MNRTDEFLATVTGLFIGLSMLAAWLTHVVVCIQHATYLLLIAGAIFFPVGIVHGFGVWFGWWS